jgi:hypothetical protein
MIQLNPPLPMNTPKGEGFAHVMLDYGPESDLYWVVLITETGEIWTYANRYVRAGKNIRLAGSIRRCPPHRQHRLRVSACLCDREQWMCSSPSDAQPILNGRTETCTRFSMFFTALSASLSTMFPISKAYTHERESSRRHRQ